MKALTNVVSLYMKLFSIFICFAMFISQIYLIFFKDNVSFEEKENISCIDSLFSDLIPLVLKCSFAFMTGGIISNWKFLLVGIM